MHHCRTAILCITVGQWTTTLPSSNLGRMGETIWCFDALLAPRAHLRVTFVSSYSTENGSVGAASNKCTTMKKMTSTVASADNAKFHELHVPGCMVILIKMCYPYGSRTRNNKIMTLLASTDTMRSDMAYYHYAQKFL
jgi:hypothetical protein